MSLMPFPADRGMNKKISIVIPVYNTQDNISQCLESIYSEKKVAYEVIVVNDCSTDSTLEKLKDFSHLDLSQPNKKDKKENQWNTNG